MKESGRQPRDSRNTEDTPTPQGKASGDRTLYAPQYAPQAMTTGVLLVTHGNSGEALLEAARSTLGGNLPLETRSLSVKPGCDPRVIALDIKRMQEELGREAVLILTDLYGSTPCNVSTTFYRQALIHIVSGVNLAMLIKVMNYHSLSLPQLARKALEGGRNGVLECRK